MNMIESIRNKLNSRENFEDNFFNSVGVQAEKGNDSKDRVFEFILSDEYSAAYDFYKNPTAKHFCNIRNVCLNIEQDYLRPNQVFNYMIDKGGLSLYIDHKQNTADKFVFDDKTQSFSRPNHACSEDSVLGYLLLMTPYDNFEKVLGVIAKTPECKNLLSDTQFMAKYISKAAMEFNGLGVNNAVSLISQTFPQGYDMASVKEALAQAEKTHEYYVPSENSLTQFFDKLEQKQLKSHSLSDKIQSLREPKEPQVEFTNKAKIA